MKWVTFSRECGFNIIEAIDEQSAEMLCSPDTICLDELEEFDQRFIDWLEDILE